MRLSNFDLGLVLKAVGILNADIEPATLPARTDSSVRAVVSTDVLSFEGFGSDQDYRGPLWYSPAGCVPIERLQIMAEHVFEHALVDAVLTTRVGECVTTSDYQTLSAFKRTVIYNEFFKYISTDRQMTVGLRITPTLIITVSLCRFGRDFSGRDRAALQMLVPHLAAAFRNARYFSRAVSGAAEASTMAGYLTVDSTRAIRAANPQALYLIGKFFKCDGKNCPDELSDLVQPILTAGAQDYWHPKAKREFRSASGTLCVTTVYNLSLQTANFVLELKDHSAASLPITARETEVMGWIARGKTDSEIASILHISVRTVQKHVENIFMKLGVETRTAAMARFVEASSEPLRQEG